MIYYSKSEKETQKVAGSLASKAIKFKKPAVIALEGELGAGKTTFVKGFAKALGIKTKIKSPTFVLMRHYSIMDYALRIKNKMRNSQSLVRNLYHVDCYRVRDHRDLATLDLGTIFNAPGNIILIEWPERVSRVLPKKLIRIHIDHISESKRKITILSNY